jgi:hypothetical protein
MAQKLLDGGRLNATDLENLTSGGADRPFKWRKSRKTVASRSRMNKTTRLYLSSPCYLRIPSGVVSSRRSAHRGCNPRNTNVTIEPLPSLLDSRSNMLISQVPEFLVWGCPSSTSRLAAFRAIGCDSPRAFCRSCA